MMAKRCWQERRTDYLWLLLVSSCCLSILPSVTCQYCNTQKYSPQIEISVTRSPANTLPNGTSVSLTCKVWQKDDMAMKSSNSNLRPNGIEWFNPQDRQVKECGRTESQAASVLNCTLMVGVLTKDKLGNYTCKTSNPYYYCWTRIIQVDENASCPTEPTETTGGKTELSTEKVPGFLNATTESVTHDNYTEAIQENGIKSTTQTYSLIGVAFIMLLVVFFILSYWFYRKNVQRGRIRRSTYSSYEIVRLAKWEILPWQIKYEEELGRGAFGVVYKAILTKRVGKEVFETDKLLKPEEPCQVVAVKVLKDNPSAKQREEFSHEIEQMKLLGSHQNIVSLVGCCTMYEKKFLVIEYVPFGDLLQWLRRERTSINRHGTIQGKKKENCYDDKPRFDGRRKDSKSGQDEVVIEIASDKVPLMTEQTPSQDSSDVILDMTSPSDDTAQEKRENFPSHDNIDLLSMPSTPQQNSDDAHVLHLEDKNEEAKDSDSFTTQQLFSFAWQIARGMNHLAEKNLIHRDLAARNILVGSDNRVKVSDFGLMRQIYVDMNSSEEKSTKLPLKWMAPESIFFQSFSIKSDTWSYGILLWEMATLGGVPYPTLTNSELCRLLKTGYRMERPDMCSDEVYELMCECWNKDPSSRPSFLELINSLELFMTRDVPYCDLSKLDETSLYYNFPAKLVENSGQLMATEIHQKTEKCQ